VSLQQEHCLRDRPSAMYTYGLDEAFRLRMLFAKLVEHLLETLGLENKLILRSGRASEY
jgi:hypothetical protein